MLREGKDHVFMPGVQKILKKKPPKGWSLSSQIGWDGCFVVYFFAEASWERFHNRNGVVFY